MLTGETATSWNSVSWASAPLTSIQKRMHSNNHNHTKHYGKWRVPTMSTPHTNKALKPYSGIMVVHNPIQRPGLPMETTYRPPNATNVRLTQETDWVAQTMLLFSRLPHDKPCEDTGYMYQWVLQDSASLEDRWCQPLRPPPYRDSKCHQQPQGWSREHVFSPN